MLRLNELVLENAQNLYITDMNDWFKSSPNINTTTPFFNMDQLRKQHHNIQDTVTIDARNKWKGQDSITYDYKIRLNEVRLLCRNLHCFQSF